MPVTSTNVATNGLDAMPGSTPSRRKMSGSIEPTSVPHRQIIATACAITMANDQRLTAAERTWLAGGSVSILSPLLGSVLLCLLEGALCRVGKHFRSGLKSGQGLPALLRSRDERI